MKNISYVILATLTTSLVFSGVAQAQSSCTITGPTGPGSNNQCINNQSSSCTTSNTNTVTSSNNNSQSSSSGSASGNGATSGNAGNSNSSNTSIGITNGGCAPGTTSTPQPPGTPTQFGTVGGASTTASDTDPQVSAPVGAVGAGVGGTTILILGASMVSFALGLQRLWKLSYAQQL